MAAKEALMTSDDVHAPAPPVGGTPRRGGRRRPVAAWSPWLVAVLALVTAAVVTAQWLPLRAQVADEQRVEEVAIRFVTALTNWDATGGLDATRETIRAIGTGPILADLDEFFASPEVIDLVAVQARSAGTLDHLAVHVDGDEAVAFAAVTMDLSNRLDEGVQRLRQQIRVELERVDGSWWVVAFETAGASPPGGTLGEGGTG